MKDRVLWRSLDHISMLRSFLFALSIVLFFFTQPAMAFDVNGFVTVSTEHYELIGNTMPTQLQEVGRVFEDIYSMVAGAFPPLAKHVPHPIRVIYFQSLEDFNELTFFLVDTAKYRFESEYPGGYVVHSSDGAVIITWRGGMTKYFSEMAGDIARVFLRSAVSDPPLWLDEGMVVFFGTMKRFHDRYTVGNIPKERLEVLRKGILPIGRLIRIPGNSSLVKEDTDSRETFLVQSAYFISCLFYAEIPELKNSFSHYIQRLVNGEDKNEALLASFPGGLIGLQAHFNKKIADLLYPYTSIERSRFVYRPFSETTPMPPALVHAWIGEEFLRHHNLIKAQQHFLRGLSVDEAVHDNALGMARVLLAQNQEQAALPYLERIEKLDEAKYQRTLAFFALDRGKKVDSLERFRRCGTALDRDIVALKAAAGCAFDLLKTDEAQHFVDKIDAFLGGPSLWTNRLIDHFESGGDTLRAIQLLLRLMQSVPDSSIHMKRFLTLADRLDDKNAQASFYLQGLRLSPSSSEIMLRLARLYDAMGNKQAALSYYRRNQSSSGMPDVDIQQRIAELEQELSINTEPNQVVGEATPSENP